MTIADTLREARFIIPDRDVPGCGWICFKDADGLISPIDYVRINHFPHIPVRPSGGENVMVRAWIEQQVEIAVSRALEKAFADLESEVSRYRGNYRGAQTEIAALKEPMSCTHPRACWQATEPDSVDAVVGYRCVACEHELLAVAAALRVAADTAQRTPFRCHSKNDLEFESGCKQTKESIVAALRALAPPANALDAHDAALRKQERDRIRDRIITDQATCAGDYGEAEEYANRIVSE